MDPPVPFGHCVSCDFLGLGELLVEDPKSAILLRRTTRDLVLIVLHVAEILLSLGIKFLGRRLLIFSEEDMIGLLSKEIDHSYLITLR